MAKKVEDHAHGMRVNWAIVEEQFMYLARDKNCYDDPDYIEILRKWHTVKESAERLIGKAAAKGAKKKR